MNMNLSMHVDGKTVKWRKFKKKMLKQLPAALHAYRRLLPFQDESSVVISEM